MYLNLCFELNEIGYALKAFCSTPMLLNSFSSASKQIGISKSNCESIFLVNLARFTSVLTLPQFITIPIKLILLNLCNLHKMESARTSSTSFPISVTKITFCLIILYYHIASKKKSSKKCFYQKYCTKNKQKLSSLGQIILFVLT